jgi:hypothetical protein
MRANQYRTVKSDISYVSTIGVKVKIMLASRHLELTSYEGKPWRSMLRHCAASPEGCGFDSRWGHSDFFIDLALPSASNRNEYQGYLLEVKAAGV